jgi:hemerythrin superfamily protein
VLKEDHREVEKLFARFERTGEDAHRQRRELADRMIAALTQHAYIEEQHLYPWMREYIENRDAEVIEAVEEHRLVKWLLTEIAATDERDEAFTARVRVLTDVVRHHVEEEESELFADLRSVGTRSELLDLGDQLRAAKRQAPTPPDGEGVVSKVSGSIERARDVGHDVADRVGQLVGIE